MDFSSRRVIAMLLLALMMAAGPVAGSAHAAAPAKATLASADQQPGETWSLRCTKPDDKDKKAPVPPKQCEVFQRLSVKKTGQRVAELAVGFPDAAHKDMARGVLILPLGILLTDDLQMQIDATSSFKFKVRYCTTLGCFAYLDLNKAALDALRAGRELTISGKAYSGQDVAIKLQLTGLDKALKKL